MIKKIIGGLVLATVVVAIVVIAILRSSPAGHDTKVIAMATYFSHPSLDALQENLKKELERQGYVEGKNVRYIIRNANSQDQLTASIANELAAQNPDVIVAVTTPMSEAVAKVARCPVVFAAVSDPVKAGLVTQTELEHGKPNITGTSDLWPYEKQMQLIRQITPNAKRLGALFNPGDTAGVAGMAEIKKYAPTLGFEIVEGPINTTNDVYPVAQNLAPRVDALFLSSDNKAISGVAAALKVAVERKLPLYVGDSGTVEKGGLAAVSVGYIELGTDTGKIVARVLRGERNIPTLRAQGADIYLNKKAAEMMGVTIPPDVLNKATKVYDEIKQ
jgi:putative tryptophan/tyrosine transport system substrate-binding protein